MSIKLGPKVVEALLIVASILLAFAIDAWWDERKDRRQELKILASLKTEFEANLEQLDRVIDTHNTFRGRVEDMERLSEEQVRDLPQKAHSEYVFALCLPFSFNAVLGTTETLVGAGRLELIEDLSLRVAITGFLKSYEDTFEDIEYVAENHKMLWPVEVRLGGPWTDPAVEVGIDGEVVKSLDFTPLPTAEDVLRIRGDREFMGLVKRCHINVGYYLTELEPMRGQVEEILELIEASIGS